MLLIGAPPEPVPPLSEVKPPVPTLIPPLDTEEPPVPIETLPPVLVVPAWVMDDEPPVPTGLFPPLEPGSSGVVPPELQATKHSKEATVKIWGLGFDQE